MTEEVETESASDAAWVAAVTALERQTRILARALRVIEKLVDSGIDLPAGHTVASSDSNPIIGFAETEEQDDGESD